MLSSQLLLFVQVSVGTLLAFTMVAISVLILRYVPPDEVPVPSTLQSSIDSVSSQFSQSSLSISGKSLVDDVGTLRETEPLLAKKGGAVSYPLIKQVQGIMQPSYLVI